MGGKERKSLMMVLKHTNRKVVCVMFSVEERGHVPEKPLSSKNYPGRLEKFEDKTLPRR